MHICARPRVTLASGALVALVALVTAGTSLLAPRLAEACSPPFPQTRAELPAPQDTAVPTNAHLWIEGNLQTVTIRPEVGISLPTALAQVGSLLVQVKPRTALEPNTRYIVDVDTREPSEPLSFGFTTGAGPEVQVPAAPDSLAVVASELPPGTVGDCIGEGFRVSIQSSSVEGAAFYQLLERRPDGFGVVETARTPSFSRTVSAMPTPVYAIRPVAISGLGPEDEQLPSKSANTYLPLPGSDDDGGCSASPSGASFGGTALLALILGLSFRPRRRRG